MGLGEIQKSSKSASLLNTWITYEDVSKSDKEDIEWKLSRRRSSKRANHKSYLTHPENINITQNGEHNNANEAVNFPTSNISVPGINLHNNLTKYLLCLKKLENEFHAFQSFFQFRHICWLMILWLY